jgi:hypothetical protein
MNERGVIKVLIHTVDGRYLAREGEAWRLTRDCSKAALFDYPAPGFADQLKGIPNAYGSIFVVVPFDALKAYGTCDRCGRMVMPRKAFFDGKQFLC